MMKEDAWKEHREDCPAYNGLGNCVAIIETGDGAYNCTYKNCPFIYWTEKIISESVKEDSVICKEITKGVLNTDITKIGLKVNKNEKR